MMSRIGRIDIEETYQRPAEPTMTPQERPFKTAGRKQFPKGDTQKDKDDSLEYLWERDQREHAQWKREYNSRESRAISWGLDQSTIVVQRAIRIRSKVESYEQKSKGRSGSWGTKLHTGPVLKASVDNAQFFFATEWWRDPYFFSFLVLSLFCLAVSNCNIFDNSPDIMGHHIE